jgi:GTP-binding protein Era
MVAEARTALPEADVIVWVVDVARPPAPMDRTIAGWINSERAPVIVAMNKSDLLAPEDIRAHTEAFLALVSPVEWTMTIATAGHGVDRLWGAIVSHLPEGEPLFPADQLTDQTERALVAEIVREAALHFLSDEVPHGVAAVVDEWTERPGGALYLACTLVVERSAHKPIVIGRGGAMLRRIGTRARHRIEALLERQVYLDLSVRVRDDWRSRDEEIRRLGYG